jgi:hypothetical protein
MTARSAAVFAALLLLLAIAALLDAPPRERIALPAAEGARQQAAHERSNVEVAAAPAEPARMESAPAVVAQVVSAVPVDAMEPDEPRAPARAIGLRKEDGTPLAGIALALLDLEDDQEPVAGVTGEDGICVPARKILAGRYLIRLESQRATLLMDETHRGERMTTDTSVVDIEAGDATLWFDAREFLPLRVRVVDASDGRPLARAGLALNSFRADRFGWMGGDPQEFIATDDGVLVQYRFERLSHDVPFRIAVGAPGYETQRFDDPRSLTIAGQLVTAALTKREGEPEAIEEMAPVAVETFSFRGRVLATGIDPRRLHVVADLHSPPDRIHGGRGPHRDRVAADGNFELRDVPGWPTRLLVVLPAPRSPKGVTAGVGSAPSADHDRVLAFLPMGSADDQAAPLEITVAVGAAELEVVGIAAGETKHLQLRVEPRGIEVVASSYDFFLSAGEIIRFEDLPVPLAEAFAYDKRTRRNSFRVPLELRAGTTTRFALTLP